MDRFQEMRAFVTVVQAGSFVDAADALQLSKTTISRLVSELESRLGVRLLHRTTRKLSLTKEGELFQERCAELLRHVDAAEEEITAHAGEAVGMLKITVPVGFGMLHLTPLWPAFMKRHQKISLDVTLSDRVMDLVDEGYDMAVRIGRLPSSSLISRQFATTRLVVCASPAYLRKHGTPLRPSDIAEHSVIAYTLLTTGNQWQFEGPEGKISVDVNARLRSNSGDTCCAAALQGQGIVLQPTFLVGPHLRSGALIEVLPQYRASELGIFTVYPSRKHVAPKVRVLIEFLAESFRRPAWPA